MICALFVYGVIALAAAALLWDCGAGWLRGLVYGAIWPVAFIYSVVVLVIEYYRTD